MNLASAFVPILSLLLVAAPAAASTRIGIAAVKGDSRGAIGTQLNDTLCSTYRCVPGALAGKGAARLQRARKMGVKAAVFAAVKRRELAVALLSASGKTLGSWQLALGRDRRVPADQLDYLAGEIGAVLEPSSRRAPAYAAPAPSARSAAPSYAAAPRAAAAPSYASSRTPAAEPDSWSAAPAPRASSGSPDGEPSDDGDTGAASASAADDLTATAAAAPAPAPAPRARASARPAYPAYRVEPERAERGSYVLEAGLEPSHHVLRYPSDGKAPVGFAVNLSALPRLHAEWYPWSSYGAFVDGAYLPGVPLTASAASALKYKLDYLRFRLGGMARYATEGGTVFKPSVAWEVERVTVRASNGARFAQLPDLGLAGPAFGLDVSMPVGPSWLSVVGGGRFIWWVWAGELVGSTSYFPKGKAMGFVGDAGLAARVSSSVSLRLLGSYGANLFTMDPVTNGKYTIRWARADSYGAQAWVRWEP